MKILYMMFAGDYNIHYEFYGDAIQATIDGVTDTFDFTDLRHDDMVEEINTTLSINPIISVDRKESGELYVKLLKTFKSDEKYVNARTNWVEV